MPAGVTRWMRWAGFLRWADALVAWVVLTVITLAGAEWRSTTQPAVIALVLLGLLALLQPLRVRWRPLSAIVGQQLGARLRPGDRAWYVSPGQAEPVLVTGRRGGGRFIVAQPGIGPEEGLEVRTTRVLLVPEDRV
jgi:hypothetical protein